MNVIALSPLMSDGLIAVVGAVAGGLFGFIGGAWRERKKRSELWRSGKAETYRQLRVALDKYQEGGDPKYEALYDDMYSKVESHEPSRARDLVEQLGPDLAVAVEKMRRGDISRNELLTAMREDVGR